MSNNPRRTVALNRSTKTNDATITVSRSLSSATLDRLESAPSKDSFSHDPFVSISRAINSAKIRAGNRLRTMSTSKYPRPRQTFFQTLTHRTTRTVLITIAIIGLLSIISQQPFSNTQNVPFWHDLHITASSNSPSLKQALAHRPTATSTNFATGPWIIGLIADLDKESCYLQTREGSSRPAPCGKANMWVSYLKRGILRMPSLSGARGRTEVSWLDEVVLHHKGHFELEAAEHGGFGGRGMELSELEWFNEHLLTPDDHTGFLLEIMSPRGALENASDAFYGKPSSVPPSTFRRAFLYDGDGEDKESVFKAEWMAVKGDKLYVGGHGRPYTDAMDGTVIKSNDPKWVKVIDKDFIVTHVNWTEHYNHIAETVGVSFPGYLMHETVLWSAERSEWVFLPRRMSLKPFDPKENERKGWNYLIIVSEDFKTVKSVEIAALSDPSGLRGFSSAEFIPGTRDRLIAALRTTEIDPTEAKGIRVTETYFSIFEVTTGRVIYKEERISHRKYEGFVFL